MTTATKVRRTRKGMNARTDGRAIGDTDPWFAHNNSSHIPNAETQRALQEDVIALPEGGLAELWNEK